MKEETSNPTSFKLGELKAPLQKEAHRLDRSLHWLVLKVLREYIKTLKK